MRKFIYNFLKPLERTIESLNRIEISQSAILNNLQIYQDLNPDSFIFPVLKSNAYGHGLELIAQILKNQKLKYICVDSYYEYLQIKSTSYNCKTLIIGYNKPKNYKLFNFKKLAITVYDLETIKALIQTHKPINIHLKIDTGMNRQGLLINDLPNILNEIKKYPSLNLEGIMTHLADADNPNNDNYTQKQIQLFKKSLKIAKDRGFKPKYRHIANSAAAIKLKDPEFNSIRLGLGLYGYSALDPNDHNYTKISQLKPSLRFISTIIQTKLVPKGAKISYNLTFNAANAIKIGIIPAGYYEGINRRLSNKGLFAYNSQKNGWQELPILGRICMNLSICDLTNSNANEHDEIIIINNQTKSLNSIENIAKLCNTIPYVITTNLAESIRRIIVN
ncbi:MAG: alanine racemase [Candidatus Buchananbacteria bacterium]|nr:alanine racemase [Candidatus Buchananbacteria bacterium]